MSFSSTSTVPIEMLPGIGRRTARALRVLHIRTIGQFKSLPENILIELFGPSIRLPYYCVNGAPAKYTRQCRQSPLRLGLPG